MIPDKIEQPLAIKSSQMMIPDWERLGGRAWWIQLRNRCWLELYGTSLAFCIGGSLNSKRTIISAQVSNSGPDAWSAATAELALLVRAELGCMVLPEFLDAILALPDPRLA